MTSTAILVGALVFVAFWLGTGFGVWLYRRIDTKWWGE